MLSVSTDCDFGLGRTAIGIGGQDVKGILHVLNQRAALRKHLNTNRPGGHHQITVLFLCMISLVHHIGLQRNPGITLISFRTDKVFLKPEFKGEIPILIQLALDDLKGPKPLDEFRGRDLDFATGHRFAKGVLGRHGARNHLARLVKPFVHT